MNIAYLDDARARKLIADGKRIVHKPPELEFFNASCGVRPVRKVCKHCGHVNLGRAVCQNPKCGKLI